MTQEDDLQTDERTIPQFHSERELTVRNVRCIIIGCRNAGKTTLFKRLQNISFNKLMEVNETEMVDVHFKSFEVLTEENTIQSKLCFMHF